VKSNIDNVGCVYYAPYSKKFAYSIDTGLNVKFFVAEKEVEVQLFNSVAIK